MVTLLRKTFLAMYLDWVVLQKITIEDNLELALLLDSWISTARQVAHLLLTHQNWGKHQWARQEYHMLLIKNQVATKVFPNNK